MNAGNDKLSELKAKVESQLYTMPSIALARAAMDIALNCSDIKFLKKIRKEMLRRRFQRPLIMIKKTVDADVVESDADEYVDRGKQARIIREAANVKKTALDMVRAAIYSHGLRQALDKLKPYVPPAGDYISTLLPLRYNAILVYKRLLHLLSSYGITVEETRYLVEDLGVVYGAKEEELELIKEFVKIEETRTKKLVKPLIRIKLVRKLLAAAAVSYANEQLPSKSEEGDELKRYNEILAKHHILPYTIIDAHEGHEALKDELAREGFGYWEDETFFTNPKLVEHIKSLKSSRFELLLDKASKVLAEELLRVYRDGLQLPGMVKKPTLPQLMVLLALNPDIKKEDIESSLK